MEVMVGKMLEWTGERYLPFVDPKICGAEIHYEHLHRYHFALPFVECKKKSLIWLAEKVTEAISYQNLPETLLGWILMSSIKHASCKYIRDNLEFKHEWAIKDSKMIILYHKWWSYA